MFSIVVGFRNREIDRVKRSLDSILNQNNKNVEVVFVDYGSEPEISNKVSGLLENYDFVTYVYEDSRGKFWNRGHALNIGIRLAKGELCILWDIDLIADPVFLDSLASVDFSQEFTTHNCYYLSENWQTTVSPFNQYDKVAYVGLMVVATNVLKEIGGFDEYYMIWGVEDEDIRLRLEWSGLTNRELSVEQSSVYHQWHPEADSVFHDWWYIAMLHYVQRNKTINRNEGKFGLISQRKTTNWLDEDIRYFDCKLWDSSRLRFLPFYNDFNALPAGEYGRLTCFGQNISAGKLEGFVAKLNRLLESQKFFNYRLIRKEKLKVSKYNELSAVYQWLCWFIGENRDKIEDYHIEKSATKLVFSFLKK